MTSIIIIGLLMIIIGIFLIAKSANGYKVAVWFIDNNIDEYKKLPSPGKRMFYLHIWTVKGWKKWMKKNEL